MKLIDLATWLALGCLPLFIALDFVYRARRFDTPRFWRLRALAVTIVAFALSFALPMGMAKLLGDRTILDLSGLGTWAGALTGILVYELCHYWYHRAVHRYDPLWRALHQMHHSAESLDAWGAYYLAPQDAALFIAIATAVFGPLLGLSPEAAAIANLFLTFNAIFQHANIRTPQWLGYIIQRPESHGVHHERGVHGFNYSDLPLWDIVFGTFRNPATFDAKIGFYDGASTRVLEMLVGKDVTVPPAGEPASRGEEGLARVA
ncbi:MAG TPA: sterol desaturase family protein [Thermoanaerobaculia bacterium]|nr:sterol desaturase family protein [Thermoanaerobaculia bacterium]